MTGPVDSSSATPAQPHGLICSACGYDNILGADECEECGQALTGTTAAESEGTEESRLLDRPLLELNPRRPECVERETSLAHVIARLKGRNVGCVLVTGHGGELIGIFTERDVLYRVIGLIDDPENIPVESLMTPDPTALKASDPISRALHMMGLHGFRHVPIVDDDERPVGFISLRDIVGLMEESFVDP
jgi:CBS domain-containing protein